MKLPAILSALFLAAGVAQAQDAPTITAATMSRFTNPADFPLPMAPAPFKQANVVYILTKDSASTAFHHVGQALLAAGYTLASANKDFWSIATNAKGGPSMGSYTLSATVTEQKGWRVVALRGQMSSAAGEIIIRNGSQMKSDIRYAGMKGSILMNGWLELDKIAKAYPNAQVGYWSL